MPRIVIKKIYALVSPDPEHELGRKDILGISIAIAFMLLILIGGGLTFPY